MGVIGYKAISRKGSSVHGMPKTYELGKTYEEKLDPFTHRCGMHFCLYLEDVQQFVANPECIVKVEALGRIEGDGYQYATNKMKILEVVEGSLDEKKI